MCVCEAPFFACMSKEKDAFMVAMVCLCILLSSVVVFMIFSVFSSRSHPDFTSLWKQNFIFVTPYRNRMSKDVQFIFICGCFIYYCQFVQYGTFPFLSLLFHPLSSYTCRDWSLFFVFNVIVVRQSQSAWACTKIFIL